MRLGRHYGDCHGNKSPGQQQIFQEPNEDGSLRDPTGFSFQHPSDNALYKRIGDLLKSVVPIPRLCPKPHDIFGLAEVYGSAGPEIIKQITQTGNIVFHAFGYWKIPASNLSKKAAESFQRAACFLRATASHDLAGIAIECPWMIHEDRLYFSGQIWSRNRYRSRPNRNAHAMMKNTTRAISAMLRFPTQAFSSRMVMARALMMR